MRCIRNCMKLTLYDVGILRRGGSLRQSTSNEIIFKYYFLQSFVIFFPVSYATNIIPGNPTDHILFIISFIIFLLVKKNYSLKLSKFPVLFSKSYWKSLIQRALFPEIHYLSYIIRRTGTSRGWFLFWKIVVSQIYYSPSKYCLLTGQNVVDFLKLFQTLEKHTVSKKKLKKFKFVAHSFLALFVPIFVNPPGFSPIGRPANRECDIKIFG